MRWVDIFKVSGLDGGFRLACGLLLHRGETASPEQRGIGGRMDVAVDRCGSLGLNGTQSFLAGVLPGLGGYAGALP